MLKNKALIAPLGLVSITILSGVFLMSSYSYATSDNTDIVDEINITVPISCTMSGTGMTSHTANMSNGSYTPNIGTTTLKVFCNDTEGFAIFAAGYTGDEIGGTNSTKLVNSASQVNNTISTGTATSGNTSNWAMKLATNSSATYAVTLDNGFGAYSSVPSSYTKVAHRNSGTDIGTTATGAELTTTYAAFVNQTQPAGTYVGKVIYTLVHPANEEPPHEIACEARRICYNPNTITVLGEMGKQANTYSGSSHGITNGSQVTLWAPNFKRDGYGFAGWNTAYDYSGTNYGPNQTITAPADVETNGLSLYAMWIPSQGILQNWNGCGSLTQGAVTALTDSRDNNTYAVAKLADNKCWMIENLRLDSTSELTASNTNNPSLPLINSWYLQYHQNDLTTSNYLSLAVDPTKDPWCTSDSSDCDDQSMLATNNTALFINNTSSNYSEASNVYSYGNYYNWYSATAGYGMYDKDSGAVVVGDICPNGWHLPTGNQEGDFYNLNYLENIGLDDDSVGITKFPVNYIYSGTVYNTSVTNRSNNGYYWTSTAQSIRNNSSYLLYLNRGNVRPGTDFTNKYEGLAVRCVAGV